MKASHILILKRGLDPVEAAEYIGSDDLLRRYVKAGWVKPFVQGKRLTRYDRLDLDRCIDRHKLQQPEEAE